ncbi:hypothetical protein, partial [Demequina globuliformis]|uniref:hypothetical protein n=1 Tax=Demequina globuliformis TaxID=676202 RepID=UPI000B2F63D2
SMTITPTTYELQPNHGWATTHQGFYAIPDTTPQTTTVTLAGTTITLKATPTTWEWTSTDGDHITHTQPSRGHNSDDDPITFSPGERRIGWNLTTTWTGSYTLNGTTRINAPGTATTTSPPRSIHLYTPTPRLVDCDLNGHCTSHNPPPHQPAPTLTDPDADGTDNHTIPDNQIDAYLE